MKRYPLVLCALSVCAMLGAIALRADCEANDDEESKTVPTIDSAAEPAPVVPSCPTPVQTVPSPEPMPLSQTVLKGLDWLVANQHESGGWGQGEESPRMQGPRPQGNHDVRDLPNVADTSMAALALIRAGSTPSAGPHSTSILRAIGFVCSEIEKADDESLWITDVRGTRIQSKIGRYADTFLAALLLAEVKDHMPDDAWTNRVSAAMEKTMSKIEAHQQSNGQWAGGGWAGGLSNAIAVKAINRSAQVGFDVDDQVRERAERNARDRAQVGAGGRFSDDGRSAGIELYAAASAVGELADNVQTNVPQRRSAEACQVILINRISTLRGRLAQTDSATEQAALGAEIKKLEEEQAVIDARIERYVSAEQDMDQARVAIANRMNDARFVAGFGTNGGEEFLSYLNIGEALVVDRGEAWDAFQARMHESLGRVQNDDGSWTGHHCITGRTFCTASALLVLTVDRSPAALAATITRQEAVAVTP